MSNYSSLGVVDALERKAAIVHGKIDPEKIDAANFVLPTLSDVKGFIDFFGLELRTRDKDALPTDASDDQKKRHGLLQKENSYIRKDMASKFIIGYDEGMADDSICHYLLIELSHYLLNIRIKNDLPVGWSAACTDIGLEADYARYMADAIMLPKAVFMYYIRENTFDAKCDLLMVTKALKDKFRGSYLSNVLYVKERGVQLGLWQR